MRILQEFRPDLRANRDILEGGRHPMVALLSEATVSPNREESAKKK